MGRRLTASLTLGIAMAGAPQALAQVRPWEGRAVAAINAGYQATTNDFTQTATFEEFVEEGAIDTDYDVEATPIFDACVAVRIWRNLGAGVAISYYTNDTVARVEARLPHPLFDNRFRTVTGESPAIERTETGIHFQAVYMLPLSDRLQVLLSGGPSFLSVSQDLVTRVAYEHAFPFDTATFRSAATASDSASAVGVNAGADVTWRLTRNIGFGGGFRYAKADVDLEADITVKAGGFQGLGGLRLLF
jgi:hypothetical protein